MSKGAVRDELTAALRPTWDVSLGKLGFRRVGRRDFRRVSGGLAQLFNIQLSAWGSRDFCVNVAAFSLCGHETPVLQPGFRLWGPNGGNLWLPAHSSGDARKSVEIAWNAAEIQALPWLERNSTLEGHLTVLRAETWGAQHHLHYQIGIVEALLGQRIEAKRDLIAASRLYAEDGAAWCARYVTKAIALIDAIDSGTDATLLESWHDAFRWR